MSIVKINSLSHEGRGIAYINGKTTFVANALPNETVEIEYLRKHNKYDEAKAINILEASENRETPKCKHFGICHGCSLQHIKTASQIELKQNILIEQFKHFANIDFTKDQILDPLVGPAFNYRRKARLSVKYVAKKNKVLVGFHEQNGRYVADLESCAILDARIGDKISDLANLIQSLSVYDKIPQIEVTGGDNIVALVFRCLTPPTENDLIKLKDFAKKHVFEIYLQNNGLDSVTPIFGSTENNLTYSLEEQNLVLSFLPTDFVQINSAINKKMINQALNLLEPKANETVLDLFCGLGNFTLPLAQLANEVIGVEGDANLINRAKQNALANNITNATFYVADLNSEIKNFIWANRQFDKILLDPPRTGALEICKYLPKLKAKKIIYISCNPATLARDCKELVQNSYKLETIGILDMFPHTKHVESMALLIL